MAVKVDDQPVVQPAKQSEKQENKPTNLDVLELVSTDGNYVSRPHQDPAGDENGILDLEPPAGSSLNFHKDKKGSN